MLVYVSVGLGGGGKWAGVVYCVAQWEVCHC